MRNTSRQSTRVLLPTAMLAMIMVGACQTTTNTNTANVNATPAANANMSPSAANAQGIDAREPEAYQAKLTVRAQTTGSGTNIAIPAITADVARSGADRRFSFVLPGGEEVIYLDRADKRYVILPKRKQYAELTPQSTGFEVPRVMTPGQVVEQIKNLKGYERVGEETVNGRPAIKYRYSGTSSTGTQAGDVKTEATVLIDKDTGLPLRSDTIAESQSGNVKGVTGLNFVTEMSDIKTVVDPAMFEIPAGMAKVSDQQVRQSVDAVGRAVLGIVGQLVQAVNNSPSTTASPAATVSPSPVR